MGDKMTIIQALMLLDELQGEYEESEVIFDSATMYLDAMKEEHDLRILPAIDIPNTKGPLVKRGKGKYKRF